MLYLAYGSNMNVNQMRRRCPNARPLCAVQLKGWKLVMRGVADVEPDTESSIPAALWRITKECEQALDRYEGFPRLYIKKYVPARVRNIDQRAMFYVMREKTHYEPAHGSYVDIISEGYADFGFESLRPLLAAQQSAITAFYSTSRQGKKVQRVAL